MFILNENNINTSLDKINLITLTYYSAKSEVLNIYDTNFEFDENIVPLLTSVLETKSIICNAKRYCNVNSESIAIIDSTNRLPNKSLLSFPCFFTDLQNGKLQNIQGYNRNLINSLDSNNENVDNMLIRMYNLEQHNGEFGKCVLNEEEMILIIWDWEYANFQIIIHKENPKECQMQLNVYITEENKMIGAKIDFINTVIQKIDKIKNEMMCRIS
jgi:hypothetical protein